MRTIAPDSRGSTLRCKRAPLLPRQRMTALAALLMTFVGAARLDPHGVPSRFRDRLPRPTEISAIALRL
jgi:hypothetical protein